MTSTAGSKSPSLPLVGLKVLPDGRYLIGLDRDAPTTGPFALLLAAIVLRRRR